MNRIGKALTTICVLGVIGLALADPRMTAIADTLIRGSQIKSGTVTSTQLSTTGVTAASYGSGTSIPSFTVDAAGRITAASGNSISSSLLPASVTKGNLIGANGSAWSTLGVGADGTVLTADATQTLGLKWAAATGGGSGSGGLALVETHTASTSATLDFTLISSTYDEYVFEFINIVPATNATTLQGQVTTNAGSTWDSSAVYARTFEYGAANNTTSGGGVTGASAWDITGSQTNAATGSLTGHLVLYNPASTASYKTMDGVLTWVHTTVDQIGYHTSLMWKSTTAINGIRFKMNSGNITSGTIRMYGVAKTNGSSAAITASAYRATNQTLTHGSEAALTLSNTDYDTSGFWSAGSPTRLTVPSGGDGTYAVRGTVKLGAGFQGVIHIRIYKNGSLVTEETSQGTDLASNSEYHQVNSHLSLVATDYVEMKILLELAAGSGTFDAVGGTGNTFFQLARF